MAKRFSVSAHEQRHFHTLCLSYKPIITLAHIALITVISSWHLAISEIPLKHPTLLLLVTLAPLLLSLWGNLSGSYKGAIGCCFISLFYFTAGVTHWSHPSIWPIGMSETILASSLFVLALLYARWKGLSELPIE